MASVSGTVEEIRRIAKKRRANCGPVRARPLKTVRKVLYAGCGLVKELLQSLPAYRQVAVDHRQAYDCGGEVDHEDLQALHIVVPLIRADEEAVVDDHVNAVADVQVLGNSRRLSYPLSPAAYHFKDVRHQRKRAVHAAAADQNTSVGLQLFFGSEHD